MENGEDFSGGGGGKRTYKEKERERMLRVFQRAIENHVILYFLKL